mgnify:CR=1 FL=1
MQHEPGVGSENSIVPPGSCLTRASNAISNADAYSGDKHFEQLRTELANDFSKGRDEYPTSLTDAHQLLLTYKAREPTKRNDAGGGRGGRSEGGRVDGGRGGRSSDGEGTGGASSKTLSASRKSKTTSPTESPNTTYYWTVTRRCRSSGTQTYSPTSTKWMVPSVHQDGDGRKPRRGLVQPRIHR